MVVKCITCIVYLFSKVLLNIILYISKIDYLFFCFSVFFCFFFLSTFITVYIHPVCPFVDMYTCLNQQTKKCNKLRMKITDTGYMYKCTCTLICNKKINIPNIFPILVTTLVGSFYHKCDFLNDFKLLGKLYSILTNRLVL